MQEKAQNKYRNMLLLTLAAAVSMFVPIFGIIFVAILQNKQGENDLNFTQNEKFLAKALLIITIIYFALTLIFRVKYDPPLIDAPSESSL